MEASTPTFLLISSASASVLMGAVFAYAKTASERRDRALELDNEKLEKLRGVITDFLASLDLYFEHAAQAFSNADEIEVTKEFDKVPNVEIRYFKKTFSIDKDLLDKLWSSHNEVRVRLATVGRNEKLDIEIERAVELAKTVKTGEVSVRKQVSPIDFQNAPDSFFGRIVYVLFYPQSGIISGADVIAIKRAWSERYKALLKEITPTFWEIDSRLDKNFRVTSKLEAVSTFSLQIFMGILLAELVLYMMDYIPRLIESVRLAAWSIRQL